MPSVIPENRGRGVGEATRESMDCGRLEAVGNIRTKAITPPRGCGPRRRRQDRLSDLKKTTVRLDLY